MRVVYFVFCFVPACCPESASTRGGVCGTVSWSTAMEPGAEQKPATRLIAETDQPVSFIIIFLKFKSNGKGSNWGTLKATNTQVSPKTTSPAYGLQEVH